MWRLSILLARPGKENGAARKPLHRGRPPRRNSKGTAFRLFLYIRMFSCVMNTRHGRSDTTRTCDPFIPNEVRYQLRYTPIFFLQNQYSAYVAICQLSLSQHQGNSIYFLTSESPKIGILIKFFVRWLDSRYTYQSYLLIGFQANCLLDLVLLSIFLHAKMKLLSSLNKSIQKHNNLMGCQPYAKHRFRQKSERCFCISSGHRDQKGPAHFPRFLHGGSAGCIPRRRATQ